MDKLYIFIHFFVGLFCFYVSTLRIFISTYLLYLFFISIYLPYLFSFISIYFTYIYFYLSTLLIFISIKFTIFFRKLPRCNTLFLPQVTVTYRFGREEDEVMGLSFSKEMQLICQQVYPSLMPVAPNDVQQRLMNKTGGNAHPFMVQLPEEAPVSVQLSSGSEHTVGHSWPSYISFPFLFIYLYFFTITHEIYLSLSLCLSRCLYFFNTPHTSYYRRISLMI